MKKIFSIYVNLQDQEFDVPKWIMKRQGIIHICPGSLEGKMIQQGVAKPLSKTGVNAIRKLQDTGGWFIGQRGYV